VCVFVDDEAEIYTTRVFRSRITISGGDGGGRYRVRSAFPVFRTRTRRKLGRRTRVSGVPRTDVHFSTENGILTPKTPRGRALVLGETKRKQTRNRCGVPVGLDVAPPVLCGVACRRDSDTTYTPDGRRFSNSRTNVIIVENSIIFVFFVVTSARKDLAFLKNDAKMTF